MVTKRRACLLFMLTSLLLMACGGSNSSNGGSSEESPQQGSAAVSSEKSNIALYGDIDENKTKEVGAEQPSLLLDDSDIDYAAFGMQFINSAEPSVANAEGDTSEIESQVGQYVGAITDLLEADGAAVNQLVNRSIVGVQAAVAIVVLDVEYFGGATTGSALRNAILAELGSDADLNVLPIGGGSGRTFRVSMAFWEINDDLFTWVGVFSTNFATEVARTYGDLNNGSAITTANAADSETEHSQSFTQNESSSNGADILWVIDNSGSMSEEQQNLGNGVDQFFDTLINANVDFHLATTTTDSNTCDQLRELPDYPEENFITTPAPNDSARADAKAQWSDDTAGFPIGIASPGSGGSGTETGFYCADTVDLSGFDRPESPNIVMFVSDEPENETALGSTPYGSPSDYVVRDYSTYEQAFLAEDTTYFAIVGPYESVRQTFADTYTPGPNDTYSCNGEGGNAVGGSHYHQLVNESGGNYSSICANASSWDVLFEQLLQTVAGLASSFELEFVPIASSVAVSVEGANVPRDTSHQNGFDIIYNNEVASLVFYSNPNSASPQELPTAGNKIEISYQYIEQ